MSDRFCRFNKKNAIALLPEEDVSEVGAYFDYLIITLA